MTFVPRTAPVGVALLIGLSAPAGAVDAITALDEYDVKSAIILNCHQGQDAADRAYLAKGDELRRAALGEVRAQLDAADPAHRAQTLKKAEEQLRLRH